MAELDKIWKNCLQMWKWIAEVYDGTVEIVALKRQWLRKHRFTKRICGSCFFCQYVVDNGSDCDDCPGALVDESFYCNTNKYDFSTNPAAFYAEILRLDAIRTEGE